MIMILETLHHVARCFFFSRGAHSDSHMNDDSAMLHWLTIIAILTYDMTKSL